MSINNEYPVKMLKDSNGDPFIPYGGSLNVSIPVNSIVAFDGDSEDIPDGFEETSEVTAEMITFDNTGTDLESTNVQDAIVEAASQGGGSSAASEVSFNKTGTGMSSTNVQDAIVEARNYFNIDKVYPVGAIYLSTTSTNPGTLFGGTWERIQDKFLFAADNSSYTAGQTGGAYNHTHSVPGSSHSHTYGIALGAYYGAAGYESSGDTGVLKNGNGDAAGWTSWKSSNITNNSASVAGAVTRDNAVSKSTASTGSTTPSSVTSGSSSNMPPYLAVYMWKRTA